MKKRFVIVALLLGPLLTGAFAADEPAVKKSASGICHERGKGSYSSTKHFEPYNSLEECIASGGRAAANAGSDKSNDRKSWLSGYGGRLLFIFGGLAVVYAAYRFTTRGRRAPSSERQNKLEQKKWEGHRLDRGDGGPKPPIS